LLRLGDLAVDVGANAGYFTLLFSDIVGASGEVHAFEPIAPTFDRLTRMIRSDQQFDNVTLNCAACGDVDGIATMMVPGGDWGQAALVRHDAGSWALLRRRGMKRRSCDSIVRGVNRLAKSIS
jgi:FkbM family methyltransferase